MNSWSSIQNINNCRLGIWKKDVLLNLIKQQDYSAVDKFYSCKDLNEAKCYVSLRNVK